ncbi:hypothetical protein PCE1_000486 [Barthelona sp. PCE]
MRTASDSFGALEIPDGVYYGASTARAIENFNYISAKPMPRDFVLELLRIKKACAMVNKGKDLLEADKKDLITEAVDFFMAMGKDNGPEFERNFPISIFQTGSGTSTNMNVNECICGYIEMTHNKTVHPNDDVNMSQSSNDVCPAALTMSFAKNIKNMVRTGLSQLISSFRNAAARNRNVVKIGRTHLMDAVPVTFGFVFDNYADLLETMKEEYTEEVYIHLGGTAVGNGLNAPKGFNTSVVRILNFLSVLKLEEGKPYQQSYLLQAHKAAQYLSMLAGALLKIAGDVRLMASGPRSGLCEITLQALQPGSSIMPGKVNPVICESLTQVCFHVQGLSSSVERASASGQFELNTAIPLVANNLCEGITLLTAAMEKFAQQISTLKVNKEHCQNVLGRSLMLVTNLNSVCGYDQAAMIAKKAFEEDRLLKDVVVEILQISEEEASRLLKPRV